MTDANPAPRSLADQGNAARLRGDLSLAHHLLEMALAASREPYILGRCAALRITERKFRVARALLEEAEALERKAGNLLGRANIILQRSLIFEHEGDPAEDIPSLVDALLWSRSALTSADDELREQAGRLSLVATGALAHRLYDIGESVAASQMVVAADELCTLHGSQVDRLKLAWLAARIKALGGDAGAAERALRELRPLLEPAGMSPLDQAILCLDVAVLAARRSDLRTVRAMAGEALRLALRSGLTAETVAAASLQRLTASRSPSINSVAHALGALRRHRLA